METQLITENENIYAVINRAKSRLADAKSPVRIMIIGFGSAAKYLLEFLTAFSSHVEVIIATRDVENAEGYINCIRMSHSMVLNPEILHVTAIPCDVNDVIGTSELIHKWNPEFIVNTTRFKPGIKYGSKSWPICKAYGYWSPISAIFPLKIAEAIKASEINTIFINTSYPDAVNALIVKRGFNQTIFGAGNVNHIIPRMKNAIVKLYNSQNPNKQLHTAEFEIALCTSHYHDVLIGKEGHDDGIPVLINCVGLSAGISTIEEFNAWIYANYNLILEQCVVKFPADATRNMMVAASCAQIIQTILLIVVGEDVNCILSIPGAFGNIGGYPVEFTSFEGSSPVVEISNCFPYADMVKTNKDSILCDGIEDVSEDGIKFGNIEKLEKFEKAYGITGGIVDIKDFEKYAEEKISTAFM